MGDRDKEKTISPASKQDTHCGILAQIILLGFHVFRLCFAFSSLPTFIVMETRRKVRGMIEAQSTAILYDQIYCDKQTCCALSKTSLWEPGVVCLTWGTQKA